MKNVLIVKLSAIGDVIHAMPVSHAIKETFPEARVTWVVEPPAYDLVAMNPCVDRIITFRKKDFRSIGVLFRNYGPFKRVIKEEQYDAVLDLQGLFKSAAIARLAKAPLKLGTCNMREMSDRISRPVVGPHAEGHIVERYLDVARELGCRVDKATLLLEVPERSRESARRIVEKEGAHMENPYVVFAMGANWPNKRWPVQYYARLGDWFYDRQVVPVIVGDGPVDYQRVAELESLVEVPPINLVGKTDLKQLTCIIQNARLVLGGDTGPVHLAAGLGVRTLMLMGPTDANRNGPYGQPDNVMEVNRPCRHCWKRACPHGIDCLAAIAPETVEKKIMTLK